MLLQSRLLRILSRPQLGAGLLSSVFWPLAATLD
jgi:hypothetical protein